MTFPPSCGRCALRPFCGGDEHQMSLAGCLTCAFNCPANCDWVCPRKPDFPDCLREVHGLGRGMASVLSVEASIPQYVPMIRNGFSQSRQLPSPFVAVPIGEFMRNSDTQYGPIDNDAADLRSRLRLRSDAKVILVAVAPDRYLERFWALRRATNVYVRLSKLGLLAMTTPNFSFFEDAPRVHTIWNRRRIVCVTEELATNGIAPIPHLNALAESDWAFWRDVLREHPEITTVAKEFQTGLRNLERAAAALAHLEDLQQSLGRHIHPVLIGAAKHTAQIARAFKLFTVIDSGPFIRAVKRQRCSSRGKWRKFTTAAGAPIDDLLECNINRRADWIRQTAQTARQETLPLAC